GFARRLIDRPLPICRHYRPPFVATARRGAVHLPESRETTITTSPRPLRIAHVVCEPYCVEAAFGVPQVVYCLTWAQAHIGQSVAVFSKESGVHIVADGSKPTPRVAARHPARRGTS